MSPVAEQLSDLVGRIEAGDPLAESQFIERYARSVRLILIKRIGSVQLANDLCQDTLVVALLRLRAGELRNPLCLTAFVRQIAVNISFEHFRREQRYVQRDCDAIAVLAPHRDHKASSIDRRAARATLTRVLSQLSVPRDREILRRYYLREEDKERICGSLEISPAHFDRVLYRARGRLRQLIQQQEGLRASLRSGIYAG